MLPTTWRTTRDLLWAAGVAALLGVTAVAFALRHAAFLPGAAAGWLYLLVVLPVTLRWGSTRGLLTALGGAVLLTFVTTGSADFLRLGEHDPL